MQYFFAAVLLSCTVIAFFYATRVLYNKNYKKITYILLTIVSLSSAIWSLGYGMMSFLTNIKAYTIFRGIGMVGIILFVISGQLIIGFLTENMKKLVWMMIVEAVAGAYVIFLITRPENYRIVYAQDVIMTEFTSSTIAIVYTAYCIVIALIYVIMSFDMASSKYVKRVQAVGKVCLRAEILLGIGMFIDTVLPALGVNLNIPASAMIQFIGLEIFYRAIHRYNRNQISMENMTGYIYKALKTPVMILDKNHNLKLANVEAEKMFDLDGYEERMESDDSFHFWNELFSIDPPEIKGKKGESLALDVVYKKNKGNWRLTIDPIIDEYRDYNGYIVVGTDMTAQIKSMQMIEQAKNDAETANKAKSQFLANMSHEIRNPMNAILGFSEIAMKRNSDEISDLAKSYFSDIQTSAEGLLETINSILDISKIESGKTELLQRHYFAKDLFREVSAIISIQADKKGLDFSMDIPQDFPAEFLGDKDKIREILINLLNNAVKYTNEGRVRLIVRSSEWVDPFYKIQFVVSDTGIGMKKSDLAYAFENYKRLDVFANEGKEGTGLGLAITKAYADLLDAKIDVKSTYGEGSEFTVSLVQEVTDSSPIYGETTEHEQEKTAVDKKTKLMFKGLKVLAVDDNKINLTIMQNALELYGVYCDVVNSGELSIAKCKENSYDVIFMDHLMPIMDGIEAMQKIRLLQNGYEQGGKCKIIVFTANSISGVEEEMLAAGFDAYLSKPIDFNVLEKTLVGLLEPNQYEYVEV